jgi:lysine-specific histone demethylase 1
MAEVENQASPQTSEVHMGEPDEERDGFEGTEMLPDAEGIFRRQSQRKKPRVEYREMDEQLERLTDEEAISEKFPELEDSSESEQSEGEEKLPSGLQGAAFASRLPASRMSKLEKRCFSDIDRQDMKSQKTFLYTRNRILQLWLEDPKHELTSDKAIAGIEYPYKNNEKLVERIHEYLARHGLINFGVYNVISTVKKNPLKVLVIGAGVAGLTTARQLQSFGSEVVILEARVRVSLFL